MIKKFKDRISFLSYLTSPENYGDLTLEYRGSNGSYGEIVLTFQNKDKVLDPRVEDKLYQMLKFDFLESSKIEIYTNIDSQTYTFGIVNGALDIKEGSYYTSHSYEEDEIEEELKEITDSILFENYTLTISITGTYAEFRKEPTLKIENFYLGIFDDQGTETTFYDVDNLYKNQLVARLEEWANDFSERSSSSEYTFESYTLEINDSTYYFIENCDYPLHEIEILEVDESETFEEIEIQIL